VLEAIYDARENGSELPFVAAIGHESDTTLAELVSDFRASTPTAAAVRLVPSAAQHREAIAAEKNRLQRVVHQLSKQASLRIEHLSKHFTDRRGAAVLSPHRERLLVLSKKLEGAASPSARLSGFQARLAQQQKRLSQAQRVSIERRLERLEARRRQLAAIAPDRVLSRGYSLTTDEEGRVIRRSDAVEVGASITTRLAQGALRSQVLPPEGEGE
jgi:exodeoxyribonuclease VII large subunit